MYAQKVINPLIVLRLSDMHIQCYKGPLTMHTKLKGIPPYRGNSAN